MASPRPSAQSTASCALCTPGSCTGGCAGVAPAGLPSADPADALTTSIGAPPPPDTAAVYRFRDVHTNPDPGGGDPFLRVTAAGMELVTMLEGGRQAVRSVSVDRARELADALTWAAMGQEERRG